MSNPSHAVRHRLVSDDSWALHAYIKELAPSWGGWGEGLQPSSSGRAPKAIPLI